MRSAGEPGRTFMVAMELSAFFIADSILCVITERNRRNEQFTDNTIKKGVINVTASRCYCERMSLSFTHPTMNYAIALALNIKFVLGPDRVCGHNRKIYNLRVKMLSSGGIRCE